MLGSSLHVNYKLHPLNYLQQDVEIDMERSNPLDLPQGQARQRKQQKQRQECMKLHTMFSKKEGLVWLGY